MITKRQKRILIPLVTLLSVVIIFSLSGTRFYAASVKKDKPLVIVSTDIGGNDPDDFQSMVHLLMYSDKLDIIGLISSPPGKGRKSSIDTVLNVYARDFRYLSKVGKGYPSPRSLRKVCMQGAIRPQQEETPDPYLSEGAAWIVRMAKKNLNTPVYVLVWGSLTDVAQAVQNSPEIKNNIRVYSIGSWNTKQDPNARDYLYNMHRDLWWIENNSTFRGMYMGGDQDGEWGNRSFVEKFVKGHGALGNFFYSKKPDIKMGDTPSVLYLVNGDPSDPVSGSWGGSFVKTGHGDHFWTDNPDKKLSTNNKNGAVTVSRWRTDFLGDWAKRMMFLPLVED